MKQIIQTTMTLLLIAAGLTACAPAHDEKTENPFGRSPGSQETPARENPSPDKAISFVELTNKVLQPHCIQCHSPARPKGGVDLTDFNFVKNELMEGESPEESFLYFVIESEQMPPRGMPPEARALALKNILLWAEGGFEN